MNVPGVAQAVNGRTKALKSLLKDPFVAFLAAWQTGKRRAFLRVERKRREGLARRKRRQALRYTDADKVFFAHILAAGCAGENWAETVRSNAAAKEGLDEFLGTIADLMLSWIPHHQKDDAVIRWFDANSFGLAKKMQEAQRASVTWLERPNSLFLDGVSKPKLDVMRRFDGQKDLRQAATTAAYSLWGTFISEDLFQSRSARGASNQFCAPEKTRYFAAMSVAREHHRIGQLRTVTGRQTGSCFRRFLLI